VGWTYAPIALWVAAIFAVAGMIGGAFGGATSGIAHTFHIGAGVGFGAAVIGIFVGALFGLVFIYTEIYNNLFTIIGGLISGLAVSLFTLWLIVHFEHKLLQLRGYRELSRREKQLIDPVAGAILERMGIAGPTPVFYVSDSKEPAAWTYANSIVVAQGLLGSYDDSENPPVPDMPRHAFAAVIAHEISHWARADGVGIRAVWACCWPIVAIYNFACILGKERKFTTLGWILFWPAWVSINLIVIPMLTKSMRQAEYEADARTASLGDEYRAGLRTALGEFQDWEAPRTGWEDVLHATHPPIEHRLQRLETPPPPPLPFIHADGLTDITVTDPDVIHAHRLYAQALADGNAAPIVTRERELYRVTAAWLRRVKQAKERGEQTDVADSLADLDGRIADFDRKAATVVSVALTNAVLGDMLCHDPAVVAAGTLYVEAQNRGELGLCATREHEQHTAIVAWLRKAKQAMEQGAPVDVTETIEGLDLRIIDYEQKAAALLQQTEGGPTTAA
jgi:Zn-dependent protease with chaperone function